MKIRYIIWLLTPIIFCGCSKFLDVNKDPNNLIDAGESNILPAVETVISTNIAGGNEAVLTNEWMQVSALNEVAPNTSTYQVTNSTFDDYWYSFYTSAMENLYQLNIKADANGNDVYAGIAKVLMAYTLGYATDLWGDIPYSQSFEGVSYSTPVYDSQEDIYKNIQSLLDSAITQLTSQNGISPDDKDYFYSGDADQWKKMAYTLKARNYIHLINASGYDKATQAQLALDALTNGMTSNDDDCKFTYDGSTNGTSAWNQHFNIIMAEGIASTLVDSLLTRKDPRISYLISPSTNNNDYKGLPTGVLASDINDYSSIGSFYGAPAAYGYIVTYDEALFIKAEATYYVSGYLAAQDIYEEAVKNNLIKMGISITSDSAQAYLAKYGTLESSTALSQIMYEKSIANFLSVENYTDWRRTGYPVLNIVTNASVSQIPRRFLYPKNELTENPNTPTGTTLSDRVWWDAAQ